MDNTFSPQDEALFLAIRSGLLHPNANQPDTRPTANSRWSALLWLILSLLLFIGLFALWLPPVQMACLVGTLLFHETGHFAGMKWFGYRDVRMFFIPGFGAAVRGEKRDVPAWQEGIVLLLGPLPGLVLGCACYFVDRVHPSAILRTAGLWLVTVNFLNLLPIGFLDGGRLCDRLLFQRSHLLEAAASAVGMVGMVFLCIGPSTLCLSLSGIFALFIWAPMQFRAARAATALRSRWPALPTELDKLNEEQWRDLFRATRDQFGAKTLAPRITLVHQRGAAATGCRRCCWLAPGRLPGRVCPDRGHCRGDSPR